ncbi:MAG TPA: alanine racemase [Actinomycetota bacterium]|nr:alanine racemase [Actinomycetota bacterium]
MDEIFERGHPVWAEIDLAAIRHNISVLDETTGSSEVMGVVKGYAYGHGNPQTAVAMLQGGATRLGVARVAEGIHLREAGIDTPIHVLSEPPPQAVGAIVKHELTAAVYTEAFARALSDRASAENRRVPIHVKIDTGMHRVGMVAERALDLITKIAKLPSLDIEGVWSHFAVADVPDHPYTRKQLDLFVDLADAIERSGIDIRYKHIANSAAALSFPESHLDLVRCGIASYGLWPGPDMQGIADLKPALALRARIGLVKEVAAGTSLSYGLTYELQRNGRVATVAAGYADGYDRRLSGLADVLIGGRRFKVSGTVTMDQFMVDIGDADFAVGEAVTLIGADSGERISAEELAEQIGTINYEVTTRIPSRVPRIYLNEQGS